MKIAEITLPSKPGKKPKFKFLKPVKFKCTRCGTFCCHLGSPELTVEDFKAVQEKFGKKLEDYLEKREIKIRQEDMLLPYGFKTVNDSECIFFRRGRDKKSQCEIYEIRPLLCRTFPFVFQNQGNKIEISVIPCPGLKFGKKKKKTKTKETKKIKKTKAKNKVSKRKKRI
jgi:hypothetical protein